MSRRIPWGRLVAEGVLIVVSILLAFAIDAWWDGRADRAREAAALEGLEEDFRGHVVLLDLHRDRFERRLEAAELVLAAAGPSAPGTSPELMEALGVVGVVGSVRFQGGTLETLVSTSGLSLLGDARSARSWSAGCRRSRSSRR